MNFADKCQNEQHSLMLIWYAYFYAEIDININK
jgi:hypothetical protein